MASERSLVTPRWSERPTPAAGFASMISSGVDEPHSLLGKPHLQFLREQRLDLAARQVPEVDAAERREDVLSQLLLVAGDAPGLERGAQIQPML
jgi:hypothetical protein